MLLRSNFIGVCRATGNLQTGGSKRGIWRLLGAICNQVDKKRIQEVGPDRACAEWLLKCGAQVRWSNSAKFVSNFNLVANSSGGKSRVIEEIDADEARIMELGFPHFEGCNHIKKIRFNDCMYLCDKALSDLRTLKGSLEHLEVGKCAGVTESGLSSLVELSNLKTLHMYDLPAVSSKQDIYNHLTKGLPECEVNFKDSNEGT